MTGAAGSEPLLCCRALDIAVPGRELVRGLDLECRAGRVLALLGRNGAGKSSTLRALAGLRPPEAGEIIVQHRPLAEWSRRELALTLGFLPQSSEDPFPATVMEAVLVGRHPHVGFWEWESGADLAIARQCLAQLDLADLEKRDVTTLSGGERRRLAVATILAQDPRILLLDEPIQQLDPRHQIEVLRLLRGLANQGRSIVMSLHEVGLAARFADDALLLHGDGRWASGPCATALDEQSVSALYGLPLRELAWDQGRTFIAG